MVARIYFKLLIICSVIFTNKGKKKLGDITITTQICDADSKWKCLYFDSPSIVDDVLKDACDCTVYGFNHQTTLCADFIFAGPTNLSSYMEPDFINVLNKSINVLKSYMTFVSSQGHCGTINTPVGEINIPLITQCRTDITDDTLAQNCKNPDTQLPPVEYNENIPIVFKNVYCALCNGVNLETARTKLVPWIESYQCRNTSNINNLKNVKEKLTTGECSLSYSSPNPQPGMRYCYLQEAAIQINKEECKRCRPNQNETLVDCFVCKFSLIGFKRRCNDLNYQIGLRTLFELPSKKNVNGNLILENELCDHDEQFDALFQSCRRFTCPFDQHPLEGRCVQNTTLYLTPESQPFPNGTKFINLKVTDYDLVAIDGTDSFTIENFVKSLSDKFLMLRNDSSEIHSLFTEFDLLHHNVVEFLSNIGNIKYDIQTLSVLFEIDNKRPASVPNSTCGNGSLICSNNTSLIMKKNWYVESKYNNITLVASLEHVIFYLEILNERSQDKYNPLEKITALNCVNACMCLPDYSSSFNCSSQRFLYPSEDYRLSDDGTLTVKNTDVKFNPSEYEIHDSVAHVCYNLKPKTEFFNMNPIQTYVSYICSGISILALIVTLITYGVLPELRNLPGKLTIFLSMALIIGQSLLLLPDVGKAICRYLAVLTHFCWLSVFMWMAAISTNMFVTFRPNSLNMSGSWRGDRAFRRYTAACILPPLTVCVTLLILDVIPGGHLHVQYGVSSCVWMAKYYGYIFMFFVPVGTILLINIILFSLTLYYIQTAMQKADKVTGRKRDRDRCIIYIKLSSVMGFTWIFGFIAAFTDVSALWFVYIVLNGFQGLYIFLSFGLNSRTREKLKKKILSRSLSRSSKYVSSEVESTTISHVTT